MSRAQPTAGCIDLALAEPAAIDDAAEVALEDYARVLFHAPSAEAVRTGEPPRVTAVHLCGMKRPPSADARSDLDDFARDLAARAGSGGLGWS